MLPELPFELFVVFAGIVVCLALTAPLGFLFLADLALVVYPGEWLINQVHVDFTDVIYAGIAFGILVRPVYRRQVLQWRRPYSNVALFLVVFVTLASLGLLVLDLRLRSQRGGVGLFAPHTDFANVMLIGLGLVLLIEALRWRIPAIGLCVLLGATLSIAYVTAEVNADYFAGPLSIAYQVYRYCWRPILVYPLAIFLLRDRKQLEAMFLLVVVTGTACAVMAFSQGYAGQEATGPFLTKNGLGGALIMPFLLAVAGLFHFRDRWSWRVHLLCILLIARSLLFAGSRGAFAAVIGGAAFLACWLLTRPASRSKTIRFVAAGLLMGAVAVGLNPDLLDRPNVQQFFSTSRGTEDDNMRWRLEERWPHFWKKTMEHPWFGIGTDVDTSLGDAGITPHNGYLGVAVVSGLPSLLLLIAIVMQGMRNGIAIFRHSRDPWQRVMGLAIASAIVALLIHNMVDQTLKLPFAHKVMWLLIAGGALLAKRPAAFLPATAKAPSARRAPASLQVAAAESSS